MDIEILESVDSTNNIAASRIGEGCGQWHTVVAKSQTVGQGRLGRNFFSPEGTGLYMSIVLYPHERQQGLLTGMAAVAVCKVLEREFGLSPVIKWVNDIFVGGRKVCGILAKGIRKGGRYAVILGIGINLFRPEGGFPEDIAETAGYLFEKRDEKIWERLLFAVLRELKQRYTTVGEDDSPEEYRKRCITIGRNVVVIPAGRPENKKEAQALFVDDSYHLTVEYPDGERESLSSGEVSVKI